VPYPYEPLCGGGGKKNAPYMYEKDPYISTKDP